MPEKCQSPKAVAEANVTITIKGLAICNYNQNNRNWEAVFPRHVKHHNLKIIVNKCRSGILESSQTYDIDAKEKIAGVGAETVGNTPEEFAAYIRAESEKYARQALEVDITSKEARKLLFESLKEQKKDAEAKRMKGLLGE